MNKNDLNKWAKRLRLMFLSSFVLLLASCGKADEARVFIEGGSFLMGSNDGEDNEMPIHKVTIPDFYIGKYEVTNQQYADFLNAKGNQKEGGELWLDINDEDCQIIQENGVFKSELGMEHYPVAEVTWYGAKAYAEWVGGRLPSEAEWEYVARGGNKSKAYKYSGSNDVNLVACYDGNSSSSSQVGIKQANELGVYDMSGNVWEWCQDTWHSTYTNAPADGSAWLNNDVNKRVLRGGGLTTNASYCRVACRIGNNPLYTFHYFGFRVAWDVK